MQLVAQDYLDLVEASNKICFVDIESTGLKGDYNSVLVVSVKPYDGDPVSFKIKQVGNDQKVVRDAKELLEKYHCWVGYYSKMFDIPMLNTRLLKWGQEPIDKRLHLDMYFTLKYNILTGRKSQAHLLRWLNVEDKDPQKMDVGADIWSEMGFKLNQHLPIMVKRCESDVIGLQSLYEKTRHLVAEIKR